MGKANKCGWSLEFKIAGSAGKAGMWQCVLGHESLMINGVFPRAEAFFSEMQRGVPDFLEVSDLPGDMDRDSLLNLNMGPYARRFFVMTSADRYELRTDEQAKSVKALRHTAESMIDHVFGYLSPGRFMPVAGPASVWRIIMAV